MSEEETPVSGPDLTQGIAVSDVTAGTPLLGHVGDQAVLLVRLGAELLAVGATCTHYSGPLAEGIVVGDTIRCPWHHACFNLRTGAALRPPALNPLPRWRVEQRAGMAFRRWRRRACRSRSSSSAAARRAMPRRKHCARKAMPDRLRC